MAAASRKLIVSAPGLVAPEFVGLGFSVAGGPGDDSDAAWEAAEEKLAELLRSMAAEAQAFVERLIDLAASALVSLARAALTVALPAAAVASVLLVGYWCCVVAGRRRRRGPDGEEVEGLVSDDGPVVVRYGAGTVEGSSQYTPTSPSCSSSDEQ